MSSSGSVDITSLVNNLQGTFVTWATNLAFGAIIAIPGLQWIALPIISTIVRFSLNWVIGILAADAVLEAFFLSTAITKASQAGDYQNAVTAKNSLSNPTLAQYAAAEQAEIAAFNKLVTLPS